MDNINVIRIGFFAPQTVLNDTDMNAGDPVNRKSGAFTCLAFINADEKGVGLIKAVDKELNSFKSAALWQLSMVVPLKPVTAQKFKAANSISARLFCDGELTAGKSYCIVDTQIDTPSYYPTIFFIGDEGTVRQRYNINDEEFSVAVFRDIIGKVI